MYKTVTIGGKQVEMLANAATPYRYSQVFHDDFMQEITTDVTDAKATNLFTRLGYIMAMQAAKSDMAKLNVESFIAWLEQFGPQDVVEALQDIAAVYSGTAGTESDPK